MKTKAKVTEEQRDRMQPMPRMWDAAVEPLDLDGIDEAKAIITRAVRGRGKA